MPVDQHQLIALIAPRPVYIASAEEDQWADPRGEFLSAYHAGPVYKLYSKSVLTNADMPEVDQPLVNTISYHIRNGGHDITTFDWEQYIYWAKKYIQ